MPVRSLNRSVPMVVRAKGLRYQQDGAVVAITATEWSAHAIVRGGRNYQVEILFDHDELRGSCDCPYFADRGTICKHIWAALLEADARKLLGGDGTHPLDRILYPGDFDWTERSTGAGRTAPAPPPAEWQRFLSAVHQEIDAQQAPAGPGPYASGELIYALDGSPRANGRGITLNVLHRQRRKSGAWGRAKPALVSGQEIEDLPDPEDREIHSYLLGAVDQPDISSFYGDVRQGRATYVLHAAMARWLLPRIARTGRLHVTTGPGTTNMTALAWDDGPAWRFELGVTSTESELTIGGTLVRDGQTMPLAEPALLLADGFLIARNALAPFDPGDSFAWVAQLRRASTITFPASAADSVAEALARAGVNPDRLPVELRYEVRVATPRPRVTLARTENRYSHAQRDTLNASLEFEYDGAIVPPGSSSSIFDAGRRVLFRRDLQAEQQAAHRLRQLGFQQVWDYAHSRTGLGIPVEHFPRAVRMLVAEGWRVQAEGRLFRAARDMHMRVSSGVDWLELHGYVEFGDGQKAALRDLLAALDRGDGTVTLDDGTRGLVPEEWLRRYSGIARFGEAAGDHVRFRPSQTALLDALLASQPAVEVDDAFDRARAALRSFSGIAPLDAPALFTGTLREYQREALGWFAFLRSFGFGGCLADDMGLGKTVMVMALLASRRADRKSRRKRPSIVVVPRSLVFNWIEEARRFTPGLRVLDCTGTARNLRGIGGADLILATYGTLRRDIAQLKDVEFDYAILDEAQAVKNPATAAAKSVRLLNARHRLALSGTPIENHLGELWSLFEFLNPGFLGSAAAFKAAAVGPRRAEPADLAILARAVRPFILRRTKAQVAPELPERSEQTIHCELEGPQRRLYDQLRSHYQRTLIARIAEAGINRSRIQILEALLRLRQAACHAALVDPGRAADPSAKLDVLLERLSEVVAEGHKALVFSQFTSFLALVRARLDEEKIPFAYLDGDTRDRATPVARFQEDAACPVFLISLKAGGLGLNLTAAEYVFLLDPWWNPAVEAQAIDRAHRIGQTRHVFAYRLIARDTVEEKVAELQQSKRDLADAILSADAGTIADLKAEDVEWLLS